MTKTDETQEYLANFSTESLDRFDAIASAARAALRQAASDADVLVNRNSLTGARAIQNVRNIHLANRADYNALTVAPASARVAAVDSDGKLQVYFICRSGTVPGISNLANYRAPIGRLAALEVGDELPLANGLVLKVVEQARLFPFQSQQAEWDSKNSVVSSVEIRPTTVTSLRALLAPSEDLVGSLLAEAEQAANVRQGIRRSVISKMTLRDQPILDRFQDAIFRLPIDSQLLIMGPPGTGKTTTLIHRLAQKLDVEALDARERSILSASERAGDESHPNSWTMFAPTQLLRLFLKEAFAREHVPASDDHIKVWANYRSDLARTALGLLRTANDRGGLVLREGIEILSEEGRRESLTIAAKFDAQQRESFIEEIRGAAQGLRDDSAEHVQQAGLRVSGYLAGAGGAMLAPLFLAFHEERTNLLNIARAAKEQAEDTLRRALNLQLNRDKNFAGSLAMFVESLDKSSESVDQDEEDDAELAQETATAGPERSAGRVALDAYYRVLRAYARAIVNGHALEGKSRSGRIHTWLGDRGISSQAARDLGITIRTQRSASRLANPLGRYLAGVASRYRSFRRLAPKSWYRFADWSLSDIDQHELDILVLTVLKNAQEILSPAARFPSAITTDVPMLGSIAARLRNQIVVDEVTDFSPVQLGCMAALTNPRTRSFFGCGDVNQRLTAWGVRSRAELLQALPGIEIQEVHVGYRQTRQLTQFSRSVLLATGGDDPHTALPESIDSEGVPPALLENGAGLNQQAAWLGERILDIERALTQLPSVALFVQGEEQVKPVAEAVGKHLATSNVRVEPCLNGQVIGQEASVRVFSIQHIKGLEFEAVFFVSIDDLASAQPDLFGKYLYVGATRAATYLGLTCGATLPATLAGSRSSFVGAWA